MNEPTGLAKLVEQIRKSNASDNHPEEFEE